MINPFYNPEKLGLELLSFDKSSGRYEFDTLCFWSPGDGRVFTARDAGCSCPTPFEDYEGEDQKAVLQGLERVGSAEQAERIFKAWDRYHLQGELNQAVDWVKSKLTNVPYSI